MKARFLTLLALLCTLSTPLFAKDISLYDQPQSNAKVIGTIDTAKGVVPIFTSKDGTWVKVGDPQNGTVGWIKSNDLGGSKNVTFSQKIITDGAPSEQTYVIQYGNPPDQKQVQEMMQKLQIQQRNFQEAMKNMMQDMGKIWQEMMPTVTVVPKANPTNEPAKK